MAVGMRTLLRRSCGTEVEAHIEREDLSQRQMVSAELSMGQQCSSPATLGSSTSPLSRKVLLETSSRRAPSRIHKYPAASRISTNYLYPDKDSLVSSRHSRRRTSATRSTRSILASAQL